MQFLRLPRPPLAPYLQSVRTRGFEPPSTAFSALRVCLFAPRPQAHRARFELATSGFGRLRSLFPLSYRRVQDFKYHQCRRQDSNLHLLSSELSASAILRHDGARIPEGEPGTRTLMSVTSAVFKTAALPIRLALHNLVLLYCYLYLPFLYNK